MSPLVRDARTLAHRLLADDPQRLAHVSGAALIAGMAANALKVDQPDSVIAAAWLHDIGYVPRLARTGFHPLDGAIYLAREGWPDRVVLLVAHHSQAAVLAPYYGVLNHMTLLDHEYEPADDVLTFSDLRAGINGLGAKPRERIQDMRLRHADRHFVPERVREARYRLLLDAAARVSRAIARVNRPQAGSAPARDVMRAS
jgi:hypothetical protein